MDAAASSPQLRLSDKEIALRKLWLDLGPDDESVIRQTVDDVMQERADDLMDAMYAHFLSFEETKSFFPDEATLQRAQTAQKQYFRRLTQGDYGAGYVEDRLRVGSTHHRIELDPKWYMGAYRCALDWFLPVLTQRLGRDPEQLARSVASLLKVIFFDMGLAIESYIAYKEAAIRRHRDAIRELETERRVTKSILENAPIGIVSLNENLVCVECNDEFVAIVDGERGYIIGKSLFELAPRLDRSAIEQVLRTEQPLRRQADWFDVSSASHGESYWDWAAWPVKDDSGKVSGLVAMFSNASDRVVLQQQREDFVATLTHDLKTPVSATNRAVRFLLDGDFGAVSDEQKEILETILQSNTALYGLVQTLLDVYRFDSGVKEMHMKECYLDATISQMLTEVMPLANDKGITLEAVLPADSEKVTCDEEEMRRVIQNLLDNALKYNTSGGSIKVTMTQSSGKTTISVADTGRGIPAENMSKLFQRFWQAGSTGRYYASTGLGLYLCRRIIEGHGGRIWCESAIGQGSTFHCELGS